MFWRGRSKNGDGLISYVNESISDKMINIYHFKKESGNAVINLVSKPNMIMTKIL